MKKLFVSITFVVALATTVSGQPGVPVIPPPPIGVPLDVLASLLLLTAGAYGYKSLQFKGAKKA